LIVNGARLLALVDTGSEVSILNDRVAKDLNLKLRRSDVQLQCFKEDLPKINTNETKIEIRANGKVLPLRVFSEVINFDAILGMDILSALGIEITGIPTTWDERITIARDTKDPDYMEESDNEPNCPDMQAAVQSLLDENLSIKAEGKPCTLPGSLIDFELPEEETRYLKQYKLPLQASEVIKDYIEK